MTGYEMYIFSVCAVMFVATFCLLTVMLLIIVKHELRAVRSGIMDDEVINEYVKGAFDKRPVSGFFRSLALLFIAVILILFFFTFCVRFSTPKVTGSTPVPRVVLSDSMSYKRETNTYLEKYGLNNQFDTFDVILTYELPGEFELQLYDVVVYELDGDFVVHRIVDIEEPNYLHPEHRLFKTRGDAVKYSDEKTVEYSQMMAIYRGEKIQYVGSFIVFMQSPPGYICILLVLIGFVATPMLEAMLRRAKKKRLKKIGFWRRGR